MISLLLLFSAALGAEPASPALEAFFDEFTERRAGIKTLRAQYEETNLMPDETFTTPGRLLYLKPERIIRQTQDPKGTMLVDGRAGYLYEPEIKQLQIFGIEDDPQSDILFLGFDDDVRKLREAYDVKLLDQEGQQGLLITPKFNPHRDPLFEELTILFEEEHLLPSRIEVQNDDGSKTIYRVSGYEINVALDPAESQIALAEGTKVIRDNEVLETVGPGGKLVPEKIESTGATAEKPATAPQEKAIEVRELSPAGPEAAE